MGKRGKRSKRRRSLSESPPQFRLHDGDRRSKSVSSDEDLRNLDFRKDMSLNSIATLNGQHGFRVWQHNMRTFFKYKGLENYINSPKEEVKNDPLNMICINMMLKTVNKKFHADIVSRHTAYDVWTFLETTLLGNRHHQLLNALVRIHSLKYKSLDDYVRQFQVQANLIRQLDASYTDHHLINSFLACIPAIAKPFLAHFSERQSPLCLETLIQRLRSIIPRHLYFQKINDINKTKGQKQSQQRGRKDHRYSKKTNRLDTATTKQAKFVAHRGTKNDASKQSSPSKDSLLSSHTWHSGNIATTGLFSGTQHLRDVFVFDSGATGHLCGNKSLFSTLHPLKEPAMVQIATNEFAEATHIGDVFLRINDLRSLHLQEVLYWKNCSNLISLGNLADSGISCTTTGNSMVLKDTTLDEQLVTIPKQNGLYYLPARTTTKVSHALCEPFSARVHSAKGFQCSVSQIHHFRMGHPSLQVTRKMVQLGLFPSSVKPAKKFCPPCIEGKLTRESIPKVAERRRGVATLPLERLHVDLVSGLRVQSNGQKVFILITDEKTGYRWLAFGATKKEASSNLLILLKRLHNQTDKKLRFLHSDRGSEFIESDLQDWLDSHGVINEYSNAGVPEQNGTAERSNRTVCDMARSLMATAQLRISFWFWAVSYAVYLLNRSFNITKNDVPYALYYGRSPSLEHIRVFGAKGYAHFPLQVARQHRYSSRGIKAIFLGFSKTSRSYIVWVPEWRCWKECRTLRLDENSLIAHTLNQFEHNNWVEQYPDLFSASSSGIQSPTRSRVTTPSPRTVRRSQRIAQKALAVATDVAPKSWAQILSLPIALQRKWIEAYQRELDSITKAGGLRVVSATEAKDKQVIPLRELFTIKRDNVTHNVKLKVRLCCRGDLVKNVPETFAPVAGTVPLRVFLSIMVLWKLSWVQADISTAFLHARDSVTRYYRLPQGHPAKDGSKLIWAGECALYGLKNAPRLWNDCIDTFLSQTGFEALETDPCLYRHSSQPMTFLLLYVDDLLIASPSEQTLAKFTDALQSRFAIKSTNRIEEFVGIQLCRNENGLRLFNVDKIRQLSDVLEVTNGHQCQKLPMNENVDMDNTQSKEFHPVHFYQSVIGSLNFIANSSRPDISTAVNWLSRYQKNPRVSHFRLARKCTRYLCQTQDFVMYYPTEDTSGVYITVWTDSNFVRTKDGKSTYGYIIKLNSHLVAYKTKKIHRVTRSTCVAEIFGLLEATRATNGIINTLTELKVPISGVQFWCDNMAAIEVVKTKKCTAATKELTLDELKLRQDFRHGRFKIGFVKSQDNPADLFTKNLGNTLFFKHRSHLVIQKETLS